MAQGANVKVELDTKPAQKKLRDLSRQGEATARRVSGGTGEGGTTGFGSGIVQGFGVGAGFGIGKKIAGSVGVFSAIGDVIGDATSGIVADIDAGITAPQARARKAARDETVQAFSLHAGLTGDTSGAKEYFNTILKAKHLPQQMGASQLNQALGGSRAVSPDLKGPLDRLLEGIIEKIGSGFDMILGALTG